jgi:hypothetical protein
MKFLFASFIACYLLLVIASCNKFKNETPTSRNVQFQLYTDKDFSNENNLITFKLTIQKPTNGIIWDSVLAPMKIKDIPLFANKLTIDKTVENQTGRLKVGFYYTIEEVGISWFFQPMESWESFKLVDFNFR